MIIVNAASKTPFKSRNYSNILVVITIILCTALFYQAFTQTQIKVIGIPTLSGRDLIEPETALEHGFQGYINVSYVSEVPRLVIVSPGKEVNFTIQLTLIPHTEEFTTIKVRLDLENSSGSWHGPGDLLFNYYICYLPSGEIDLRVGEPYNITMALRVPEGLPGMSAEPNHLLGVGIMADVPVASEGHIRLDRITR